MTIKKSLFLLSAAVIVLASCQTKQPDATGPAVAFDADTLSYKVAKAYVKNYEKHAGTVDSTDAGALPGKRIKRPDSRAIWFSADRLEALLVKIRKEKGDGIRFYLATYDTVYKETPNMHVPDRKYWGYNTLVMVSTKDSLAGKYHQDYYRPKAANAASAGFIVGTTPENRGEMCPPPSNCPATGATLIQ